MPDVVAVSFAPDKREIHFLPRNFSFFIRISCDGDWKARENGTRRHPWFHHPSLVAATPPVDRFHAVGNHAWVVDGGNESRRDEIRAMSFIQKNPSLLSETRRVCLSSPNPSCHANDSHFSSSVFSPIPSLWNIKNSRQRINGGPFKRPRYFQSEKKPPMKSPCASHPPSCVRFVAEVEKSGNTYNCQRRSLSPLVWCR